MKRNRIVIDIGSGGPQPQPKKPSRKSRGAGRVLGFIGIILVVVIVGVAAVGFFWWQHYKSQPGYSLALLVDAAQRNDRPAMDQLIDLNKVTDSFVSQARQRATGSSSVIESLMPSQIEQAVTRYTPKVKQTIHDQLPIEIQRLSMPAAGKPFPLIAIAMPYFFSVKQDGKNATASAKINDEQLTLTMQQNGAGQWQIVGIQDDRIMGIIIDNVKKNLSPGVPQVQDHLPQTVLQ